MSRCSLRARAVLFVLGQALACWSGAARAEQGELTDFLFLVQRLSNECTITLKSSGDPQMVTVATPDGHKRSWFVEVGKPFYLEGRFTPAKFAKKETTDGYGNRRDVSELTVQDNLRRSQMVLAMGVPQQLPTTPEAVLKWRRNKEDTIKVEEGTVFQMPGGSDAPYRLIKVREDSAIIAPVLPDGTLGKEVVIKQQSQISDFLFLMDLRGDVTSFDLESSEEPFVVIATGPNGTRRKWPVQLGAPFPPWRRFTATKFEKTEVVRRDGSKKDASELTFDDSHQKKGFTLVFGIPKTFTLFTGRFEWRRKIIVTLTAREGDLFRIPGEDDTTYKLTKLQEDSAIIVPVLPDGSLGKEVVIQKK